MEALNLQKSQLLVSMATPPSSFRSIQRSPIMWKEDPLDYKTLAMALEKNEKNSHGTPPQLNDSSDPYEHYLSSEEDASISDHDNEFMFDSDDSEIEEYSESGRAFTRTSQEITAKAISFRFAGRPQIIQINNHSTQNQSSLFPAGLRMKTDSSWEKSPNMKPLPVPTVNTDLSKKDRSMSPLSPRASTPTGSHVSSDSAAPTPSLQSNQSFYEELALFSTELSQPWMPLTTSFSLPEIEKHTSHDSQPTSPGLLSANQAPKVSARSSSRSAVAALRRVSRSLRNTSVPKINLAYTPGVTSPRSPSHLTKSFSPLTPPMYDKPLPRPVDMSDSSTDSRSGGRESPIGHVLPKIKAERRISLGYSKKLVIR